MKKIEIDEFIQTRFKKIDRYFHKSISGFETEYIRRFRAEVKRLKVFLHLISMESEDGLSYRIARRMKTIYGYFGIICNLQMQAKKVDEHTSDLIHEIPAFYVNRLEKEQEYWKKLSKDFIDDDYSFNNDKQEIMTILPDGLNKKSIKKFVHYTLYELHTLSGRADDDALDSIRKFIEDIYYNYEIISPFFDDQQNKIFNKKAMEECLKLFDVFRDTCLSLVLIETFVTDGLDESEMQSLKTMENECLDEKKDIKKRLVAALDAMNIKAVILNPFAVAGTDD